MGEISLLTRLPHNALGAGEHATRLLKYGASVFEGMKDSPIMQLILATIVQRLSDDEMQVQQHQRLSALGTMAAGLEKAIFGTMAYGSFVKKHPRTIKLAGCWAHARRNFYEAREQAPQRCGWILRQIAHLYRIEEDLRRSHAGARKRAAVRSSQSRLICQRL